MSGPHTRLDDFVARHPTVPLALRAALAATAAWLVVVPLGGVAAQYPYYAPLGAVVAVSTTVLTSIRTAITIAVALLGGATLAIAAILSPLPQPVALGLVVGIGTAVAGWHRLGTLGTWVPISAIFMLIIGEQDSWHFPLVYLGLTCIGALVGTGVNLALPPLRFLAALRAQEELRTALVSQLERLADGLDQDPLPSSEDWARQQHDLPALSRRMQELVGEATGGPPVNWRVQRQPSRAALIEAHSRALVDLTFLVTDVTRFVSGRELADRDDVPLGPALRPLAAGALRALADALRSVAVAKADPEELRRAWFTVHALAEAVRDRRSRDNDLFDAGTIVTTIERTLVTITR